MKSFPFKTAALLLFILIVGACGPSQRGIIIACVGDSITRSPYPKYLLKILNSEGIRAKVLDYGRSGHSSGEYLRYLEANRSSLDAERPDFVLVQLGTNDVRVDQDSISKERFSANMRIILDILSKLKNPDGKKTQLLLGTIPPIPSGTPFPFSPESRRRVEAEINPAIFRICKEKNIPVVDNYALFIKNPHLLPEVHPSNDGYRLLAQNWFLALKPFLR